MSHIKVLMIEHIVVASWYGTALVCTIVWSVLRRLVLLANKPSHLHSRNAPSGEF